MHSCSDQRRDCLCKSRRAKHCVNSSVRVTITSWFRGSGTAWHLGCDGGPGRPAALPLRPLAADVGEQRSNRRQLHLACPCLHGLPILQPLSCPRTAWHAMPCSSGYQSGQSHTHGIDGHLKKLQGLAYSMVKSCNGALMMPLDHNCPACPKEPPSAFRAVMGEVAWLGRERSLKSILQSTGVSWRCGACCGSSSILYMSAA